MNKLNGVIAFLMGLNAGMDIVSNIWHPSSEKIPLAILYGAIAAIWILKIKEVPQVPNSEQADERSVATDAK